MKKSITLTLSDEELIELQRIMLDEDMEAVFRLLKIHLDLKTPLSLFRCISKTSS